MADLRHDYVRTHYKPLDDADFARARRIADELRDGGEDALDHARVDGRASELRLSPRAPLRGTGFCACGTCTRPISSRAATAPRSTPLSTRSTSVPFGYRDDEQALEIVNVRLAAIGARPIRRRSPDAAAGRWRFGASRRLAPRVPVSLVRRARVDCPVYQREALTAGAADRRPGRRPGIREHDAALPRRSARVAATGELIITGADAEHDANRNLEPPTWSRSK